MTMAQNDGFRNKISHGTDEFMFTLFAHSLLGTDTLMIRLRSDDIAYNRIINAHTIPNNPIIRNAICHPK